MASAIIRSSKEGERVEDMVVELELVGGAEEKMMIDGSSSS